MPRAVLDESRLHPAIRQKVAELNSDLIAEVESALAQDAVVLVGMAQNPFPKKARKVLDQNAVPYRYLEYGSYLKDWRRRNALKMWTGWPTFPMVFVKGQLIGGYQELQSLLERGELSTLIAAA